MLFGFYSGKKELFEHGRDNSHRKEQINKNTVTIIAIILQLLSL